MVAASAPTLRVHLNLPIIEQSVVMAVPAALCTQRWGCDARIEGAGTVDRAMDHWALWLLSDGVLGTHDRRSAGVAARLGDIDLRTHRLDHDWSRVAERIESHELARVRHAACSRWKLERLQQLHAELGVPSGSGLRDVPAWFGGATPSTARHFAPQPELLHGLLQDLLQYANLRPEGVFLQAVLVHYQLVMIHPFRDGNGRLARLLALCMLGRAQRPLAPLYAGFALQRWGHAYNNDALEDMMQGNVDAYIAWWARAHRFSSMLLAAISAERDQAGARLATALAAQPRLASALTRAVARSPSLVLDRFAEVHSLNAKRREYVASVLGEHGWRRVDAARWLCVPALARLIEARNALLAEHRF